MEVLVVDDNPAIRDIIAKMLTRLFPNTSVMKAKDGLEALKSVNSAQHLDLIICDINMPNMHGLQFLRILRKDYLNKTPVLVVSGETDTEFVREAAKLGVIGYILKPFTTEKFKEKIEEFIRNYKDRPEIL